MQYWVQRTQTNCDGPMYMYVNLRSQYGRFLLGKGTNSQLVVCFFQIHRDHTDLKLDPNISSVLVLTYPTDDIILVICRYSILPNIARADFQSVVVPDDWWNAHLRPVCSEARALTREVSLLPRGHRTERTSLLA